MPDETQRAAIKRMNLFDRITDAQQRDWVRYGGKSGVEFEKAADARKRSRLARGLRCNHA